MIKKKNKMSNKYKLNRRSFLKTSALASTIGIVSGASSTGLLSSCSSDKKKSSKIALRERGTYYIPELPDMADDGKADRKSTRLNSSH